jgi:poly(A) polymerase
LESKTAKPLATMLKLLADVPQSRLFDEMLKLLQTGHALASVAQLQSLGLHKGIYPLLDVVVERSDTPFVKAALADTDRRVGEGKPVAPSFLLACVLWSDVKQGWDQRVAKRVPPFPALQEAIDEVFDARIGDVSGRGKLAADMREIWMMQPRFEKRIGSTAFSLVEQPRFRAGFDFLRLRAEVADVDVVLADWWQEFSTADDAAREDLIQQAKSDKSASPSTSGSKPRRAPRRRKPAAKSGSDAANSSGEGHSSAGE